MIVPEATKPIAEQEEKVLRRMLLWGEARSEGPLGMLAVAWVAENRLGKWSASLREVILAPWQFSIFNANDPNRELLLKANKWERDAWIQADAVCELLEAGMTSDPTHGATHYTTAVLWGREPMNPSKPKWFEAPFLEDGTTKELARLGDHVFGITT